MLLKKQIAKVAHLNVREEKHGEDSVLAVDVKIKLDLANEFLDTLEPGLRTALYRPDDGQLEGIEAPMSILRFPSLAPLHWNVGMPSVEFTLHGAKKADDLVFQGGISKALNLEPKEGGTVEVSLQVQVRPEPEQMAALAQLLGKTAKVSVKPGKEDVDPESQDPAGSETGGDDTTAGAGAGAAAAGDGKGQLPGEWPFPPAVQ